MNVVTKNKFSVTWVEVRLALRPLGAVDSRPGEEHDVEGDHRALQQPRLWHVLLHHRQDRDDRQRHTDQHVEAARDSWNQALCRFHPLQNLWMEKRRFDLIKGKK